MCCHCRTGRGPARRRVLRAGAQSGVHRDDPGTPPPCRAGTSSRPRPVRRSRPSRPRSARAGAGTAMPATTPPPTAGRVPQRGAGVRRWSGRVRGRVLLHRSVGVGAQQRGGHAMQADRLRAQQARRYPRSTRLKPRQRRQCRPSGKQVLLKMHSPFGPRSNTSSPGRTAARPRCTTASWCAKPTTACSTTPAGWYASATACPSSSPRPGSTPNEDPGEDHSRTWPPDHPHRRTAGNSA